MAKSELAVINQYQLPALNDEVGRGFAEEMEGLSMKFDQVKIPSGGGIAWEVPSDDPESPDVVKELVGVIMDHYPCNAWYEQEYSGGNEFPDCSSLNSKTGLDKFGETHDCKTCPKNQYGSDPKGGKGKACKNMHRLYLLRDGEMLPLQITAPPTTLGNLSDYISKRVLQKGFRSYQVITRVTLKKADSADGIIYSQAVFSVAGVLSPDAQKEAEAFAQYIRPMTRKVEIVQEDYNTEPSDEDLSREPGDDFHRETGY